MALPNPNQQHLNKHYFTMNQLVEATRLSVERILELIGAQCAPPHSYEVTTITLYKDPLSSHNTTSDEKYYHPDVVFWLQQAEELAKKFTLTEVAEIIRKNLMKNINKSSEM